MDEQLRHQYLEAMGVSSWLPRRQLSGARPTPDWVFEFIYPEANSTPVSEPQSTEVVTACNARSADAAKAAAQARSELAASLDGKDKQPKADSVRSAPVALAPKVPASGSVSRAQQPETDVEVTEAAPIDLSEVSTDQTPQAPFKLAFLAFEDCLVVDALPPRSRQGVSQQHQLLLDKILRSIGLKGGMAIEQFMLPWPMFASRSLDQGAEQARLTVQHKLDKSLQQNRVKQVLLLGEASAQMVLQRSEPLDQLRGMMFSIRSDTKALACASLSEMMTVPGCKRDVWQDLQPLLEYIEAGQGHERDE